MPFHFHFLLFVCCLCVALLSVPDAISRNTVVAPRGNSRNPQQVIMSAMVLCTRAGLVSSYFLSVLSFQFYLLLCTPLLLSPNSSLLCSSILYSLSLPPVFHPLHYIPHLCHTFPLLSFPTLSYPFESLSFSPTILLLLIHTFSLLHHSCCTSHPSMLTKSD
jgi:hypothetical protein